MKSSHLVVVTIIGLSIAAFFIMHYVIGFSQKKSLLIAGGAGAAMILFDVVLVNLIRKR